MSRVKGWCPSAHRPMMSGDGLLVRVKPRLGRLTAAETNVLCDLADRYGNGLIDLTSRANLQLRGVADSDHARLLEELIAAGLVDGDPVREARIVTLTPFWQPGDLSARLVEAIAQADLPELPDKMGIVIDTGATPVLRNISGDFRFEQVAGQLILLADGAKTARSIDESQAVTALREMADWFIATGGTHSRRMSRHVTHTELPDAWQQTAPFDTTQQRSGLDPEPLGRGGSGLSPKQPLAYGLAFGQTTAHALRSLMRDSGATHLRVTPWRALLLENANPVDTPDFLPPNHPLLNVSACPGAPHCSRASVATRDLARVLSRRFSGSLHVSGCSKGCARPTEAALTLVGRDGRFDLVRAGHAGDTPVQTGLTAADLRLLEL